MGMLLAGDAIAERYEEGRAIVGDTLLILMNASDRVLDFPLPRPNEGLWEVLSDTASPKIGAGAVPSCCSERLCVDSRSIVLLRWCPASSD